MTGAQGSLVIEEFHDGPVSRIREYPVTRIYLGHGSINIEAESPEPMSALPFGLRTHYLRDAERRLIVVWQQYLSIGELRAGELMRLTVQFGEGGMKTEPKLKFGTFTNWWRKRGEATA